MQISNGQSDDITDKMMHGKLRRMDAASSRWLGKVMETQSTFVISQQPKQTAGTCLVFNMQQHQRAFFYKANTSQLPHANFTLSANMKAQS